MRPLSISILTDGRPGHYHLAEGVAAAIARRRPVTVTMVPVMRRRLMPGRVTAALLKRGVSPATIMWLSGGPKLDSLRGTDIVISAGGDTLVANAAVASGLGIPGIFCGTLRHLPPQSFSLVVSSYARHAGLARHLVTLKPNGMDPDKLAAERPSPDGRDQGRPRIAGLLIGGDSGLFKYSEDEWRRLIEFLDRSHERLGTRWIVSTSRRSPDHVANALVAVAARKVGPIAELIDFRSAGPGTLPRLLSRVEAVLCTEDSSTMLSEAVCARLPVVGVAPVIHSFKDDEREYRAFMQGEGWCRFVSLADLTPERFADALSEVRPLAENHLDRLADQLAAHLPQLFG